MKKKLSFIGAIIAFFAAILFLTSCTTETVYVPQTTDAPYEAPVSTDPPSMSNADIFVSMINSEYPYVQSQLGGRSELIKFGKLVCQAIDQGSTLADFAAMAVTNDVDPEMLGFIIGASIPAFCPENSWFADQYFN